MPRPALDDPRLDVLYLAVIHTVIAVNDPHSYEREIRRGDPVSNLVKVLARHEGLSIGESVEWAKKMLADAIEKYLEVECDHLAHGGARAFLPVRWARWSSTCGTCGTGRRRNAAGTASRHGTRTRLLGVSPRYGPKGQ
ncbi:terpene synthase family protein [Streptomyces sp. NPDC059708]|uniref:terpene synthase family protein n=1 Tax=Streptomyces sp. NPDC059708 TaxID=3346916 RepID=UPI0036B85D6B